MTVGPVLDTFDEQTIWVVAKLGVGPSQHLDAVVNFPEVEMQGYWDKASADRRARHLWDCDKVEATVWPVKFWAPYQPLPADAPPAPYPVAIWGAVTQDKGQALWAYAEDKHPRLRLPHTTSLPSTSPTEPGADESEPPLSKLVSSTWRAWREQQATSGDFFEAGLDVPSEAELAALYREAEPPTPPPAQLELPLPGLSAPAH